MLLIQHAHILAPAYDDGSLLIDGDRIVAIGDITAPSNVPTLNARGLTLVPGFIDLQFNGGFGDDFTVDPTTIWRVAARLPEHGVTSFLPTVITSPLEVAAHAQSVLHAGPPAEWRGAFPLGLHLEGPFLNPQKRGAHNPKHLQLPLLDVIHRWSRDSHVRLVTLAPELLNALELVRGLQTNGVVVSAGHSMADYAQALASFDAGVRYGTHLFNAMPNWDHRTPALPGALLTDARPVVGIIPDGIHVHPAMIDLAWRALGPTRMNVVTDAMAALGMPTGTYRLGDFDVTVDATSARLSDGRLAGSILSLDAALRNLIAYTHCSLSDALATITTSPAHVLGLTDRGHLAPGAIADLVLLTPDLHVAKTIAQGKVVYE